MKNPLKNFDFLDAAVTVGGVVAGNYVADPIGAQIAKVIPASFAAHSAKIVSGAKIVLGLATPMIVSSFTKDKTAQKLAIGAGAGMIANGGTALAKDLGIIKGYGAYSGLQASYVNPALSGSPQNFTGVAARRVAGSPQNMTSVAGGRVGENYAV